MSNSPSRLHQVMDWRAAIWAGIIAGAIFLLLQMILLALVTGGSPWILPRMTAAIVLGEGALSPPASFDVTITLVALIIHFVLAIGFAVLIAFILHRWGLLVGIVGGALFGLCLYAINYYSVSYLFPWFFPMRNWVFLLAHIVFGALAGGIYEGLERDELVEA